MGKGSDDGSAVIGGTGSDTTPEAVAESIRIGAFLLNDGCVPNKLLLGIEADVCSKVG